MKKSKLNFFLLKFFNKKNIKNTIKKGFILKQNLQLQEYF